MDFNEAIEQTRNYTTKAKVAYHLTEYDEVDEILLQLRDSVQDLFGILYKTPCESDESSKGS